MGRGKAVVVADTEFALNVNLEREGGQPFEGMRENADFWRWLLSPLPTDAVTVSPSIDEETHSSANSSGPAEVDRLPGAGATEEEVP